MYLYQKKYVQAAPLLLRALEVREKLLGPQHPEVAIVLHNLARLDFLQHRYAEAESLYRRAVTIMEKGLGRNHPDLGYALASYALLLQKTKRKSEAAAMTSRVREILTRNSVARSTHQTVDVRDRSQPKSLERLRATNWVNLPPPHEKTLPSPRFEPREKQQDLANPI